MSLYSHNGRPSPAEAAQNAARMLLLEKQRREQGEARAAAGGPMPSQNFVELRAEEALAGAALPRAGDERLAGLHRAQRALQEGKAVPPGAASPPVRQPKREPTVEEPDLKGFLALVARHPPSKGSAAGAKDGSATLSARTSPPPARRDPPAPRSTAASSSSAPAAAPHGLALRISIPTAVRATAAGAGARPKAALPPGYAEERLRRQVEEKRREELELAQRAAQLRTERESVAEPEADSPPTAAPSPQERAGSEDGDSVVGSGEEDEEERREEEEKRRKKEEKRKREEWRRKWKEEKKRRDMERRLQEPQKERKEKKKDGKKTGKKDGKKRKRSGDGSSDGSAESGTTSGPREPSPVARRSQLPQLATMAERSVLSFGGQISDVELDKRLRASQQANSSENQPLMSEAEVLAKMRSKRGGGRR